MIKRISLTIIFINFFMFILAGCVPDSDITYTNVKIKNVHGEVKESIENWEKTNGIYIYKNKENEFYIYLNGVNVNQGEKAAYFSDVKIETEEDSVIISFNENHTDDYSNIENNRLLYRVKLNRKYDYIKVYKNGKEISFNMISI